MKCDGAKQKDKLYNKVSNTNLSDGNIPKKKGSWAAVYQRRAFAGR